MQTQSRSDALVAAYIEQHPNRPGKDEAHLKTYGVSVWAIIGYWKANNGDVAETATRYDIPIESVEAAVAYSRRDSAHPRQSSMVAGTGSLRKRSPDRTGRRRAQCPL